jgi:hypothetical protein
VNIKGRPLNCETGAKNVCYGYVSELCGVEQLALQYYADEGGDWQGTHLEGGHLYDHFWPSNVECNVFRHGRCVLI